MHILCKCKRWNLSAALRAGLITRWLAHYPFGGPAASETTRREIVKRVTSNQTDDVDMAEILHMVDFDPDGRKQLRKCGLVGSAMWEDRDDEDVQMLGGDDTAGLSTTTGRRIREESLEEQALRRRRREAVVISDGGRPLGQRDIFERADTGGTDVVGEDYDIAIYERQTERLREETERLRRETDSIRRSTEQIRSEAQRLRRESEAIQGERRRWDWGWLLGT